MSNKFLKFYPLVGFAVIITLWALLSSSGLLNQTLFPTINDSFLELYRLLITGGIFDNAFPTLIRTISGFFLSVVIGVPLGIYLGVSPKIYKMFYGIIEFFRSLPATAMFPLFLLIFGIGNGSKVAISWFISFWIILVNSAYGVINSSKIRVKVALILRATSFQTLHKVVFKDALPQIFIGLKISLSLCLIAVVVAEMFIGSDTGLGQKIYDSYLTYEIDRLYAWLIVTGVIGYLLNRFLLILERRTVHWVGK